MNKKKYPKPDYKFWAAKDSWSQTKTAFLLHGIDPDMFSKVDFRGDKSPSEFAEVKKTFDIIHSIPWKDRYPHYHFPNVGISPIVIIVEVLEKNLRIPAPLKKLLMKRLEQEKVRLRKLDEDKNKNNNQEQALVNRERNNYLKSIGLLIALLVDEKVKSSRNPDLKLSASQIARLIVEKAEFLGMETSGLKSFDRKISEAVELINQEANTEIAL